MKLSKLEIIDRLKTLIEEVSLGNVRAELISPRQRLIQDLGLDSLDYASVLLGCEQWLRISIQEKDVEWRAIQTVEQLASFLEGQQ